MMKSYRKRLVLFLAVLGPGLITANVDNDAGGITTYSVCGAHYGYSMLWVFLPVILALIIIQEMSSRMGVVTGRGLADLMRERFGLKITFYAMLVLFAANLGNTIAEFAGIAAAGELFHIPRLILVPVAALIVWWIVVKGTYKSVEKVFLFACVFYAAYIVSGFLAKPDWGEVGAQFIRPTVHMDKGFLFMMIGLIGTTIAPWMQFYQQASIAEKGIKLRQYRYSRMDTILGGFVVNIVAIFIVLTCGATLFRHGISIQTAQDAALALKPVAGKYCFSLFAFGLLNASLFAASILPLSTAYTMCEALGWENGVNKGFREAPQFYSLYTIMIILGAAPILLPGMPLIPVMLVSQVANGLLLPFVLVIMLILINTTEFMGEHRNGATANVITIVVAVLMAVLSLLYLITFF